MVHICDVILQNKAERSTNSSAINKYRTHTVTSVVGELDSGCFTPVKLPSVFDDELRIKQEDGSKEQVGHA